MGAEKRVQIQLLGGQAAYSDGVRFVPSSLLLRLAVAHPVPVRRSVLLESLYPEADAAARNRLRVALTRLRSTVPLIETGEQVGLNPTEVAVDLCDVHAELSEIEQEPSEEAERARLMSLLVPLSSPLFPNAVLDWELAAQAAWSASAVRALHRLGELAEQFFDSRTAALAAKASLGHQPYDAEAWARRMRAMTNLGEASAAASEFVAARKQAKSEGWPFPEELEGWDQSRDEPSLGPLLTVNESHALGRFFRRALSVEPEIAIQVLGSASFRPEVLRNPRSTLPLLMEALSLPSPPSEAKERIQVRIITSLTLLEDWERAVQEVDRFIALPVGAARRRIALLSGSFAQAMLGSIDRAIEMVNEAMALATGVNAEYDGCECLAQRASFFMFRGEFQAAEVDLRRALDYLQRHAREGAEPDLLAIQGNLGLCLMAQNRPSEALEALRRVVEAGRKANLTTVLGHFAPLLALAESEVGERPRELMMEGLRAAYRVSPRVSINANAFIGKALTRLGDPSSERVVREARAFRCVRPTPLNVLEEWIFGRVDTGETLPVRSLLQFSRDTIRLCAGLDPVA